LTCLLLDKWYVVWYACVSEACRVHHWRCPLSFRSAHPRPAAQVRALAEAHFLLDASPAACYTLDMMTSRERDEALFRLAAMERFEQIALFCEFDAWHGGAYRSLLCVMERGALEALLRAVPRRRSEAAG